MIVEAILIGLAAGVLSGMLGVGGGVLFVPALTLVVGLSQIEAQATSLLAIVPVALAGSWRQYRYGHLRPSDAAWVGAPAVAGAVLGVILANALPESALRVAFALLSAGIAVQVARRAVSGLRAGDDSAGVGSRAEGDTSEGGADGRPGERDR